MPRTVSEWVGKNDDAKVPARVRDRIFQRDNGTCHICKLTIKPGETWEADHITALINGGENRESNLAPAHKHCHVGKTAKDRKEKDKVAKVRQKHNGSRRPKQSIRSAGFPSTGKTPRITRNQLPPKPLFREVNAE